MILAALLNFYRRNVHRHPAAQDRRARAELARKARIAADDRHRAKCLKKFGLAKKASA